jgi:hypothetical protein
LQTDSSVHSINIGNEHHLCRLNAKLSCFRKSTFYAGIRTANSLPRRLTALRNEKAQIKVAFGRCLDTHSLCFVQFRPVPQFTLHILWVLHLTSLRNNTYFTGAAVALLCTHYPLQQRHLSCRESSFCRLYTSVRVLCLHPPYHMFQHRSSLSIYGRQDFASALETDDSRSARNSPLM